MCGDKNVAMTVSELLMLRAWRRANEQLEHAAATATPCASSLVDSDSANQYQSTFGLMHHNCCSKTSFLSLHLILRHNELF